MVAADVGEVLVKRTERRRREGWDDHTLTESRLG